MQSYSWTLAQSASSSASSATATVSGTAKARTFAPRGLLLPFQRDVKNDFANDTGERLAVSKVIQVLGTKPGELDWNPRLGCNLHRARHKNDTPILRAMLRSNIGEAFARWLPSLTLMSVEFSRPAPNTLRIAVRFNERIANGMRFADDLTASLPLPIAA